MSRHHGTKGWHERNQQRPYRQRDDPRGNQGAFGSQVIDQRAPRRLRENSCDPADREREPDALLVPSIASEVNRDERPHPRLHVGEKEIEPIEATQRPLGRGRFGLREGVRIARTLY